LTARAPEGDLDDLRNASEEDDAFAATLDELPGWMSNWWSYCGWDDGDWDEIAQLATKDGVELVEFRDDTMTGDVSALDTTGYFDYLNWHVTSFTSGWSVVWITSDDGFKEFCGFVRDSSLPDGRALRALVMMGTDLRDNMGPTEDYPDMADLDDQIQRTLKELGRAKTVALRMADDTFAIFGRANDQAALALIPAVGSDAVCTVYVLDWMEAAALANIHANAASGLALAGNMRLNLLLETSPAYRPALGPTIRVERIGLDHEEFLAALLQANSPLVSAPIRFEPDAPSPMRQEIWIELGDKVAYVASECAVDEEVRPTFCDFTDPHRLVIEEIGDAQLDEVIAILPEGCAAAVARS
jgi:hypothetical protein